MNKLLEAHLKLLESLPRECIHTHLAMPPRPRGGTKGRRVNFKNTRRPLKGAIHSRRKA